MSNNSLTVSVVDIPKNVYPVEGRSNWKKIALGAGTVLGVVALSLGLSQSGNASPSFSGDISTQMESFLAALDASFTDLGNGFCRNENGGKGLSELGCADGCDIDECIQKCIDMPKDRCTALEHSPGNGRCELHFGQVSEIEATPGLGHKCLKYSPPTRPAPDNCDKFRAVGPGFCRNSESTPKVVCKKDSRCSFAECKALCKENADCAAVEFGFKSGRCELHLGGGQVGSFTAASDTSESLAYICSEYDRSIPCDGGGGNQGQLPLREELFTGSASIGSYLGTNQYGITGRLLVGYDGISTVQIRGEIDIGSLNCEEGCGMHIHEGVSCEVATGLHYFLQAPDSWIGKVITGPGSGTKVQVDVSASGFQSFGQLVGRTVMIHAPASQGAPRVACGEIVPVDLGVTVLRATLGPYPGYPSGTATATKFVKYIDYSGSLEVAGTVKIESDGLYKLVWELSGLEPGLSNNGTIQVHQGMSCDEIGGEPLFTSATNPWSQVTYSTDDIGVSQGEYLLADEDFPSFESLVDHAVIVQDAEGDQVACATLSHVPDVEGHVVFFQTSSGLQVSGHMRNLEKVMTVDMVTTATGGVHVHEGTTCATSGGHLLLADGVTDPWKTTTYSVTSRELSEQSLARTSFRHTVVDQNILDIAGRTFVAHASNGQRIACGTIGNFNSP